MPGTHRYRGDGGTMNGVSSRLRAIREHLKESQKGMASRFNLGANSWQRFEASGRLPKGEVLEQLAAVGYSMDWILTGKGSMFLADSVATTASVDEDLMGRIVEGISLVYKETGARISPRDLGILAARMASDVAAAYEDQADRIKAIPALLQALRRDLRTPPTGATARKHSA